VSEDETSAGAYAAASVSSISSRFVLVEFQRSLRNGYADNIHLHTYKTDSGMQGSETVVREVKRDE